MRFLVVCAMLFGVACSPPATVSEGRCGDGRISAGETCDDGNSIDEDACTNACQNAACGDGIVRGDLDLGVVGAEGCDDGNAEDNDACLSSCQPATCGDGILRTDLLETDEGYEGCDDGNDEPWDGCTNDCVVVGCGDGEIQPEMGEVCDDGNEVDTDACTNACRPAGCGDGSVWEGNEECDDGNRDNFDACLNACTAARCGDGAQRLDLSEGDEGFEACDDGNSDSDDACLTTCELARCGDGIHRRDLNPNHPDFEECDDGNDSDDDECSTTCISLGCGNGRLNEGEACDDGNIEDADACRNDCTLAACGDGVTRRDLQPGEANYEACDDGNAVDTDACTSGCTVAVCGDGVVRLDLAEGAEGFEACDDGNAVDEDACVGCQPARCGDGIVREDLNDGDDGFEECDDSNNDDGDGCSASCAREGVQGLVLYYNFESGAGAVPDLGGSGNRTDGAFEGRAGSIHEGRHGTWAMRSPGGSGAGAHLKSRGDVTDLNMTDGYAAMAWIKVNNVGSGQGIIVLGACCNPRQGYTINLESDGRIRMWGGSNNNNSNYNAYSSARVNDGNWHHVGIRVTNSRIEVLVDGNVSGSVNQSNLPTSPSLANSRDSHGQGNPHIGGMGISSRSGADVLIDEVRVYNSALSNEDWATAMAGN